MTVQLLHSKGSDSLQKASDFQHVIPGQLQWGPGQAQLHMDFSVLQCLNHQNAKKTELDRSCLALNFHVFNVFVFSGFDHVQFARLSLD